MTLVQTVAADFPWGAAVTLAGLIVAVALLAMDERNRRKFLSREDADGMRKRLEEDLTAAEERQERMENMHVRLDDRVGAIETTVSRMDERQTQQWERVSEQMANTARTIDGVTKRLEAISKDLYSRERRV